MLAIKVGPFALAVSHILILVSLLLAMLTGWWAGRGSKRNPERQLFRLLLVALLVARLAFVFAYFEHFRDQPWRVIDIRDGGFIAWPGVLAAILVGAWNMWRESTLRKPLGLAVAVGVLSWGLGTFALHALEQATRLPQMSLTDSQGAIVELQDFVGKALVINLWATWCPPCRREMPVLAEAQRNEPDLIFLFVNQGESEHVIADFLDAEDLGLENVLLDPAGRLGREVGSYGLPTTLFYDAEGRQVGSHLGELSRASLARALERLKVD
jgi:thiol-disulfide isomerase/thioredoxin